MSGLRRHLWQRLEKLAPKAQRLLVAVSGGADSVALLRLLHGGPWALHAAHFDHALRPESAEDAAFVRSLCAELEVPLILERAEVARIAAGKGWNLEDAARRLRYAFLARAAKRVRADAILTAHTRDDQAETVLMQLLRGAAYLTGMPARRRQLVRPLLGVSRAELRSYLAEIGQPWREDASNADARRTRAWLRHRILPELEARFPTAKRTLALHASLQQDAEAHFDALAAPYLATGRVNAVALAREDAALQRQAIALLLAAEGAPVEAGTVEQLRERLGQPHPFRLSLSDELTARLAYGRLAVVRAEAAAVPVAPVTALEHLPAGVSPRALELPELVYRSRRPGDRIHLSGGTKKLSDRFIDLKIPREDRDGVRLLASGPRVIWVEGLAVDPDYAVGKGDPDRQFMRQALEQAELAYRAGELPVGALVVCGGEAVARAHNHTEAAHDPSAHAEVLALRAAARALGDWRLSDCTLYVTLEPCAMCFGAALQAHVPRLVYGAANRREGALGSVADLSRLPWKRALAVRGGVLAKESERLLGNFFQDKRTR